MYPSQESNVCSDCQVWIWYSLPKVLIVNSTSLPWTILKILVLSNSITVNPGLVGWLKIPHRIKIIAEVCTCTYKSILLLYIFIVRKKKIREFFFLFEFWYSKNLMSYRINRRWFNSFRWLERHGMSQRFQHLRFSSLWSWTQKSSRRYGFFTAELGRKKRFIECPRGFCQISFVSISKINLWRSGPGPIKAWSVQTQQSRKCLR